MPELSKDAPKKAKRARVKSEMHKFKAGTMRSGSKRGPKVKNRKQAIAIAMSESGQSRKGKTRRKAMPGGRGNLTPLGRASKRMNAAAHRRKRNIGRS